MKLGPSWKLLILSFLALKKGRPSRTASLYLLKIGYSSKNRRLDIAFLSVIKLDFETINIVVALKETSVKIVVVSEKISVNIVVALKEILVNIVVVLEETLEDLD